MGERIARRTECPWWLAKNNGLSAHEGVYACLDSLKDHTKRRRDQALVNASRVFADLTPFGSSLIREHMFESFSFNQLYAGARAIASKVTATRVMPFAVTEGASWKERQKADEFNRGCVGILEEAGFYGNDYAWAMDALTFEAAVAKVTLCHGEVRIERVYMHDLIFDPMEARAGWRGIRSLHHHYTMDREQLLSLFPDLDDEKKAKVLTAGLGAEDLRQFNGEGCDLVAVTESWHLPSGPDADDGRYALSLRNVTLVDEEYDAETFPFAAMYQNPPQVGVCQIPYVTRNANAQKTLDRICDSIADATEAASKLRILKHANVQVQPIDDENCKIYEYQGQGPAPTEWNIQPYNEASFRFMQWIGQSMPQNEGIAEMSSNGSLPVGLRGASGKALTVADDTFSEQLAPFMHSRQEFTCRVGELALSMARQAAKENGGYVVSIVDGKMIRRIKFSAMDIGEGNYKLIVQPASYLSKSPAAKFQQVAEMMDKGMIGPQEAIKLLGVPDVVAVNELNTAEQDIIDKTIDHILTSGASILAFPWDNQDLIIDRGKKALHLARIRDEKPECIKALMGYVRSAYDEKKRREDELAAKAPPPMPMGGPPPMPGAPMPPPMPEAPPPDMGGGMPIEPPVGAAAA